VKLNAPESALLLAELARQEIKNQVDLRSQLADLRLKAACEALRGNVDMKEFERKVLGRSAERT
jgi:hypothetical protein